MPDRLIFIRHGETTGDVEDRYGGSYDDALSAEGEAQVNLLAEALEDYDIETVFTSPLTRAQQTAEGISSHFGCPVHLMDDLRERAQYGPLTGMTKTDAKALHPDLVEAVKDRNNTLPGAESYAEASARTQAAVANIMAYDTPECAAVVWHGGGMRVLFRDILSLGELHSIGDCCWVELIREGGGWRVGDSSGLGFSF
ncbi:MAG: hypothetical protein COY40_05350 [Alphaproteobacteria bacterium CG_4_10_14_0_8_um_filter_53_9]|nr:MAG: hypothetical protein COY40_05350 [Alphaproteobacteria bacterium CG_4_10_14_0_8_um_filter_53_9]